MSPKKPVAKRLSVRTADDVAPRLASRQAGRPVPPSPSLKLYRRIAFGFVGVVAAILVAVVYVSTVSAVIRITPASETVKTEFLLDVVRTPTRDNEIRGRVLSGSLSRTETYVPSGEGVKETIGISRGIVTLHNDTGAAQPLVRTTRLLAPDGTLFHTDKTVSVPARGEIDVPVYADKAGAAGDLPPTKLFTIPGLYPEKQKLVFAFSTKAFSGGLLRSAAIGQADIDRAAEDLKTRLTADAKTMLRTEADAALKGEAYTITISDQKSSVAVGAQADKFDLSMTVHIVGAFYDKTAVQDVASRHLFEALPSGKRFADVNASGLQATVEKVNLKEEKANVRVYLDGRAVPATTNVGLDPARFAGLTPQKVKDLLVSEGLATDVEVKLSPPFIRSIPRFKDHITVEIVP